MKKKLFKKNNKNKHKIFDLIALFAIFFITASIYFLFSRKTEYLYITIRLFNHEYPENYIDTNQPKAWYVEQIIPGKSQKNQLGETLIEIADVYSYPNAYVFNDVYVTLKIKALQNKVTKQYLYEGIPLLIHDVRSFKVKDLLISGEIIDLFEKKRDLKSFKLVLKIKENEVKVDYVNNSQVLIKGIDNHIADLLKEGITVKDSENTNLVEVTKVEKNPGERELTNTSGIVKIIDPERTQVYLHVDLLAENINDYYFYRKKESLLVGENLWLNFDQVSVLGEIISVEEN
jgi:hypothetical protein